MTYGGIRRWNTLREPQGDSLPQGDIGGLRRWNTLRVPQGDITSQGDIGQADIKPQSDIAGSVGNLFIVYLRFWQTVATPLGVVFLWKKHGPQR